MTDMDQLADGTRLQLACCVQRARSESGRPEEPDNDVYWHTREACAVIARERGVRWAEVLELLQSREFQNFVLRSPEEVFLKSEPLWTEVMHPDLLVQDIHES